MIKRTLTTAFKQNKPNEIKFTKEEQELYDIFLEEYNLIFENMLVSGEREIFTDIIKNVAAVLGNEKMSHYSKLQIAKIQSTFKSQYYMIDFFSIKKIKEIILAMSSKENINKNPVLNINNITPHCENCKTCYHTCGEELIRPLAFNYILCLNCKKIFKPELVHLFCKECNEDYFSDIHDEEIEKIEDFEKATFEEYHCKNYIFDYMECPRCKEILYYSDKKRIYKCFNCNWKNKIQSYKFKCMVCNKDFIPDAVRPYIKYENYPIKIAIKNAIANNVNAVPPNKILPCCKLNNYSNSNLNFIHNDECDGILLLGILQGRNIVVCSKCREYTYFEKVLWNCPKCGESFKCNNNYNNNYSRMETLTTNGSSNNSSFGNSNNKQINLNEIYEQNFKNNFSKGMYLNKKNNNNNYFFQSTKNLQANINLEKYNNNYNNNKKIYISNNGIVKNFQNFNVQQNNFPIKQVKTFYKGQNEKINLYNNNYNIKSSIIEEKKLLKGSKSSKLVVDSTKNYKNLNLNFNNSNININKIIHNPKDIRDLEKLLIEPDENFIPSDFKIEKLVGEGTFGKIYKATWNKNNLQYALKKIILHTKDEFALVRGEYELLRNFYKKTHCNGIIKVYGSQNDKLTEGNYAFYVLMELATIDWEREIQMRSELKKFYTEGELLEILKSLVRTFCQLQKYGIAHRDIKPQNILIVDGKYKICDFGEARTLENKDDLHTLRGTELYMSPILFNALKNNKNIVNHNCFKSDVFSLGMCILLAGTLTFQSLYHIRELRDMDSIKNILVRYLIARYSCDFVNILLKLLEIDENKRPDFIQLENSLRD
jgi:hypothetical protein